MTRANPRQATPDRRPVQRLRPRSGVPALKRWTKPQRPAREVEGRGLMRKVSVRIGDEGRG